MEQTKSGRQYSFNIVDALLIVVVLCIIAGGIYFFVIRKTNGTEAVRLEYTLEIPIQKKEFDGAVKTGDMLINTVAKDIIGTVVAVKYENATSATTNLNDGTMHVVQYPEGVYSKLIMTIRSDAKRENGMLYIQTVNIAVGKSISFRTQAYIGTALCTGVREIDTQTKAISK
ncbi:MAG: DUF4330 domain-containing protein [Oscillospiraceae bacterium]|nr:DUF4330 domain-containing protein [Oscillospiraceae bacterium]